MSVVQEMPSQFRSHDRIVAAPVSEVGMERDVRHVLWGFSLHYAQVARQGSQLQTATIVHRDTLELDATSALEDLLAPLAPVVLLASAAGPCATKTAQMMS